MKYRPILNYISIKGPRSRDFPSFFVSNVLEKLFFQLGIRFDSFIGTGVWINLSTRIFVHTLRGKEGASSRRRQGALNLKDAGID